MPTGRESDPTLAQLLALGRQQLNDYSEQPASDTAWLWSHALGRNRAWLAAHPEYVPQARQRSRGEFLIERFLQGESVAHLCGGCEFIDLRLRINGHVLAPRPETEQLLQAACHALPRRARVLELGTGSGVLALALARARPDCRITALDHSRSAVQLARINAQRLRIHHVRFVHRSWHRAWPTGVFDLILANPPYVALHDPCLQSSGVRREPRHTLVAGLAGLDALRLLAARGRRRAHGHTRLLLEHGADQGVQVERLVGRCGWGPVRILMDAAGRPRACLGGRESRLLGRGILG